MKQGYFFSDSTFTAGNFYDALQIRQHTNYLTFSPEEWTFFIILQETQLFWLSWTSYGFTRSVFPRTVFMNFSYKWNIFYLFDAMFYKD